ncbi:probable WRKY transcription factor 75 [Gastrolobium bilobum]|uniref:probable WRKY transcription factor 75 n=1 Tax=Gastrolobium bilobum TaxID=150636 RepID=UPI002AAFEBD3|nr:probable WRKY transcription factor 75 [Gastrolobium bilobum]
MENHQLSFPVSSSSSVSLPDLKVAHSSNIHVKKADDLSKTQRKKISSQKGGKEIKQHRYVFQTRSLIDILDDGYRWRKYGEKAMKNNKFRRSYYRCSYRGCNVKKQIQRHSIDEQIVVTTYEGMHIHPVEKTAESFEQILRNLKIYSQLYNVSPTLE